MDPTANLEEQRQIVARMFESGNGTMDDEISRGARLAELVQTLDEWITNGGFPPQQWER